MLPIRKRPLNYLIFHSVLLVYLDSEEEEEEKWEYVPIMTKG